MHLLEGAKISQQLLKQALGDPNFTFGIEAEFFVVGAQTFMHDQMNQGDETVEIGGDEFFVKKLGDVTWNDFFHFFKPLAVPGDTFEHDHEILRDRLADEYEEMTGEELSSAGLSSQKMWDAFLQKYRVHEMMAVLRAFPEHRILGLDGGNLEAVRGIIYDGDLKEISPFGKLNELPVALGRAAEPEKDYNPTQGHATRDAFYALASEDIGNQLGAKVVYTTDSNLGYHVSNEHADWFITEDTSLEKTEEEHDVIGIELVSPIMSAEEGMVMLDKVLAMMNNGVLGMQVITTDKTGLHVNLGVRGREIDPVKILVLSGDEHITAKFDRSTSENAASIQAEVQKRMQAAAQGKASTVFTPRDMVAAANRILQGIKADPKDLERAIEVLNNLKPEGKKHSINFEKLKSGYVEYRSIGNAGYHKRAAEVRNAILHMVGITYIATEPEAYRQEFLKKLYSMVQRALSNELRPGEYVDVPMGDSIGDMGKQFSRGYGDPMEQYRETPYDGEHLARQGIDPGSDTQ